MREWGTRIRNALAALRGSAGVAAMITREPEPPKTMRVSDVALADATASYGRPLVPWTVPELPPFAPAEARTAMLAMDSSQAGSSFNISGIYAWALTGAFSEGLAWLGNPYLAELSQRPEYRRVSEIYAQEATRKWIKFNGDADKIDTIEKAITTFGVRDKIKRVVELDGFFGRGQIFIDLGDDVGAPELAKPLVVKAKVGKGKIKNFKVVEPFWSYPGPYEATNPLHPDFYVPRIWYVMASQVHASRLLTVVGREMPDMLKPAYAFGGLSLSQAIKPYVDNFIRTRQSVSDLIHSFSTMVFATDMSQAITGGKGEGLRTRLELFNRTRDNRGVFAINKENEELTNVSTPLGTLDDLQAQSQEQIASIAGIPLVVLLGVTPSGLNASSDGEIKTFYATIKSYQEKTLRSPMQTIIELIQINEFGKIDEEITWEFVDLWEMSATDKATIRKTDAEIDQIYGDLGVVSNEEIRERVTDDEESPYFGMDLEGDDDKDLLPGPDLDGSGGENNTEDLDDMLDPPEPQRRPPGAQDASWRESQHPRGKAGQFGSGGNGGAPPAPTQRSKSDQAHFDLGYQHMKTSGSMDPVRYLNGHYHAGAMKAYGENNPEAGGGSGAAASASITLPAPGKVRQPARSWEEIATKGAEAHAEFSNKLATVAKALALRTDVDLPEHLSPGAPGNYLFVTPNKSKARAAAKVEHDYGGDWSQLKDFVRGSIAVESMADVRAAMSAVEKAGLKLAAVPKDKFANPTAEGYRDLNTLVQLENGVVAELQFHLKDMLTAKEQAHALYAEQQNLTRKNASDAPNDDWSDADTISFNDLRKRQNEIYGSAWAKAA